MQAPRNLAVIAVAVLLGACEPMLVKPGPDLARGAAEAAQLAAAGQHGPAASLYERLAARADGATRDGLLASASEQWFLAGDRIRAVRTLAGRSSPLPDEISPTVALVAAMLELEREQPQRALERLALIQRPLSESLGPTVMEIEARARFANGEPLAAVKVLTERELWLSDAASVRANGELIWDGLRRAAASGQSLRPTAGTEAVVRAWLELVAVVTESADDPFALKSGVLAWQARHPQHAANTGVVEQLLAQYRAEIRYPRRVALLLPFTGRLAGAAEAIRDGFLAAHFSQSAAEEETPLIDIYDTGARAPEAAYQQAVLAGADFVVGPLSKPEVSRVAEVSQGLPTLTLNHLPDDQPPPPSLYQFALDPEEEAAQAAQRALADGLWRALALVPNDEWGRRLLSSFGTSFQTGGGRLLDYAVYNAGATDYSFEIMRLLRLDQSRERHRALQSTVGSKLEFEPRRRQDVDFIFLAAQAAQARLIRPQLEFHYAARLPVYTTSAAYEPTPGANRDLDGMVLTDMPWIIAPDATSDELWAVLKQFWPKQLERRTRLYAMGHDAYRLVPLLFARGGLGGAPLAGLTGQLSTDASGRVHRQLMFAYLDRGVPEPLPPAAGAMPSEMTAVPLEPPGTAR